MQAKTPLFVIAALCAVLPAASCAKKKPKVTEIKPAELPGVEYTSQVPPPMPTPGHVLAHYQEPLSDEDIEQGNDGDYWLEGILAALALRHPQAIKDAITDTDDPKAWIVRIFDLKSRHPLYFRVTAPFNDPQAAIVGKGGRLWPLIIQNAVVQYNDLTGALHPHVTGYPGINGGQGEKAFMMLLPGGAWTKPFPATDKELCDYVLQHNPLGLPHYYNNSPVLAPGHMYTMVDCDPATNTISFRNPWGVGGDDGEGMQSMPAAEVRKLFWGLVFSWPP